jgi:hypothetical protein
VDVTKKSKRPTFSSYARKSGFFQMVKRGREKKPARRTTRPDERLHGFRSLHANGFIQLSGEQDVFSFTPWLRTFVEKRRRSRGDDLRDCSHWKSFVADIPSGYLVLEGIFF